MLYLLKSPKNCQIVQKRAETSIVLIVFLWCSPVCVNQADSKADYSEYIEPLGMQKTIRLPNEADFLFAYAAVPGSIFNLCLYMCHNFPKQSTLRI
jgi:hypothetical protein